MLCALTMAMASLGQPGGSAIAQTVIFHNLSAKPAQVWIGTDCIGSVAPQSRASMPQREVSGHFQLTALTAVDDAIYLNSMLIPAMAGESNVYWGGLPDAKTEAPLVEVEAAAPDGPTRDLVAARIAPFAADKAVRPPTTSECLLSTVWQGREVRGRILSTKLEGRLRVINSVGMLLLEIPAGQFKTGTHGTGSRSVTLTRPFFIAATETTVFQLALTTSAPLPAEAQWQLPAADINWAGAQQFCAALSKQEGLTYRLPTEAEWEYTCQAGQFAPFDPAVRDLSTIVWYHDNSGGQPHPVASLAPNRFGIYDMHGNVREWCQDWWGATPPSGVDPVGPTKPGLTIMGPDRVSRGGAFDAPAAWCTCGLRDGSPPSLSVPWRGFRVVLEIAE
jgi:hypothetical protein